MKRISIPLVLALTVVVAACSSEEAASAAPSEAVATIQPTPEPAESAEASEEPSGSQLALPSFDLNGDPELAARFPDTVGGEPLQVTSMRGDQMGALGGSDPTFEEFLDSIGAELSDVSFAFGGVMSTESVFSVGAFRIVGANEDDLEREFIAASEDAGDISGFEDASVGGKDVLTGLDPSGETDASFYLYTKDDTIYFLTGTEEQAAEVLEVLP
ncbi:MAG TPA: hypothetical protein VF365_02270 [Candidatus Limnocylindria bacterium]